MVYFFSLITAFYITVTLVPVIRRLAFRFKIVDNPGLRKIHSSPVPRAGGIALLFGIAIPSFLWIPMDKRFLGFLAGLIIISLFGVLDDIYQLSYRIKFLGQILAVGFTIGLGGFLVSDLGMWSGREITVIAPVGIVLTGLFILGVTNALNLIDGLDGLAGGISMFIFGCLAALAYWQNDTQITLAALVLFGAILAFLRYNTYPANIFMGDTGSQVLGFSAAVLSLYLTHSEHTPLSRTLPLLIIGFPIIDTLTVMTIRICKGGSPFQADKRHFHHRLMRLLGSQVAAVVVIYLCQAVMAVLSFTLRYQTSENIVLLYLLISISLSLILSSLDHFDVSFTNMVASLRRHKKPEAHHKERALLKRYTVRAFQYFFSIGILWLSISVPEKVINLECSLFFVFSIALSVVYFQKRAWFKPLFRYGVFVLGVYVLFSTQGSSMAFTELSVRYFQYFYWGSLAFILLFYMTITRFDDLKISSVDYLLLLLIAVTSFLPIDKPLLYQLQLSTIALIVLLWSTEILMKNNSSQWNSLTVASLTSMIFLGVKGIILII